MLCSLSITFVSCSVLYQLSSFGITEIKQLRIFKCQNTNAQQRSTRIRSIVVIVFAFVTATRSLCHLSGTLARRHFRFPRREEEHFAIYLEPWHADIFDFLDAKKNTGALPGAVKMA